MRVAARIQNILDVRLQEQIRKDHRVLSQICNITPLPGLKGLEQSYLRFGWLFAGPSCSAPSAAQPTAGYQKRANFTAFQVPLDTRPSEKRDSKVLV